MLNEAIAARKAAEQSLRLMILRRRRPCRSRPDLHGGPVGSNDTGQPVPPHQSNARRGFFSVSRVGSVRIWTGLPLRPPRGRLRPLLCTHGRSQIRAVFPPRLQRGRGLGGAILSPRGRAANLDPLASASGIAKGWGVMRGPDMPRGSRSAAQLGLILSSTAPLPVPPPHRKPPPRPSRRRLVRLFSRSGPSLAKTAPWSLPTGLRRISRRT